MLSLPIHRAWCTPPLVHPTRPRLAPVRSFFRQGSEERARGRPCVQGGSVKKKGKHSTLSASTSSTLMFTAAGGNQEAPHTKPVFMHNKHQRNSSRRLTTSTASVFH
ncbi:hypothetical protein GOP47_0010108 [Adiantum capillus-veneris]|uniref:Uncharacterized protein n=1 Tax=Adiantum capillus-veneris TaxID=13818 RepID=A0A9D4UUI5_ADICA|nr:hypothetical protein GOP47_0010108 [Adiantum capillus-veneris]